MVAGLLLSGCGSSQVRHSLGPPISATRAVSLFRAGLIALNGHLSKKAVADLSRSIALDPSNVDAQYDLGIAQTSLGHTSDAVAAYRKAIVLDPAFEPALFNLADLLTVAAPGDAITLFKRLEQIHPKDAKVEFNLGLLLEAQGQLQAGEVQLKKALAADRSLGTRLPPGTQLAPSST